MRLPGVMGGSCTQGRDQAKGEGAVEINNMESKSCGWKGEEVGWGSEGKGKGGETENVNRAVQGDGGRGRGGDGLTISPPPSGCHSLL